MSEKHDIKVIEPTRADLPLPDTYIDLLERHNRLRLLSLGQWALIAILVVVVMLLSVDLAAQLIP